MGGPVRVNGREVVTSKSGGVSFAFGDVCTVPGGGGPIPFVNMAVSADATNTARTVRVGGVPVMLARSTFARSTGDEPGADGGVISRTTQGAAVFSNYSFDVHIEGQPLPRAFDPMLHNLDASGVPNAVSPAELQAVGSANPELDAICVYVCAAWEEGCKMACFRPLLGTPIGFRFPTRDMDPDAPPGHKSWAQYWDPHVPPGWYVEPAYDMTPPPPRPMLGGQKSGTMKDKYGEPLPLPGGDWPIIRDSRRPDVVVPLDPTKPLGPGNIKYIFEVKFPPEEVDYNTPQIKAYQQIAEPNGEVIVVGPDNPCMCNGRHKPKLRDVPVPVRSPKKQKQKDPQRQEEPEPEPLQPYPSPDPGTVGILAVLLGILKKAAEVVKGIPEPAPALGPLPPVTPGFPGSKPPGPDDPVWPWSPPGQTQ